MGGTRKVVLFIAASLDGYIATQDESLDWLEKAAGEGDNGFSAFYDTVDTVIMGSRTYDWVIRQDLKEFPYKGKTCYVFTRSKRKETDDVTFVNDDVRSFVSRLKKQPGRNIWLVGGGELVHAFLQENLVDELIVTVAPSLLGKGIPLFPEGDYRLDLSLIGVKQFDQPVQLHYLLSR